MSDFKFTRVDSFLDDINREGCFDTKDMDGVTPNYRILLVSECPNDIASCVDEDGTLIYPYNSEKQIGVNIIETLGEEDGYCSMLWSKGINGERTMSISDSAVSYDFGEKTVQIKGMFLVNILNGTGYVVAYCILDTPFEKKRTLICPCDGMVWSIRYGG